MSSIYDNILRRICIGLLIWNIFCLTRYQVGAPYSVSSPCCFMTLISILKRKIVMKAIPQEIQLALTLASCPCNLMKFENNIWNFSTYFYNQLFWCLRDLYWRGSLMSSTLQVEPWWNKNLWWLFLASNCALTHVNN